MDRGPERVPPHPSGVGGVPAGRQEGAQYENESTLLGRPGVPALSKRGAG